MMDDLSLARRLYASSGRATLADLPWLYSDLRGSPGRNAKGFGGPPSLVGEPALQNLASLDPSGGGAPTSGGGGGVTFPAAQAISSPGRSGGGSVNALRNLLGRSSEDFGRGEGGGFTGSGLIGSPPTSQSAYTDRYTDIKRRGDAPLTFDNVLRSIGNAWGLITGPISAGVGSIGELAGGLEPGTLGGIQPMQGHMPIQGRVRSFGEFMMAFAENEAARAEQAERDRLSRENPFAGMRGNPGAYARAVATRGGFGGRGGGGGGYRGGGTTGTGGFAGEQRGAGRAVY
jgi:hypothetical protein